MRGFVLQDWITIRGASGMTLVTQNEADWLSLESYQDVVFWLQVAEVTPPATNLYCYFQTAPIKDESLFTPVATNPAQAPVTAASVNTFTCLLASQPNPPLSRWLRWQLKANGSGAWDITFRILVSCNQMFAPPIANWGGGGGGWSTPMR